MANEKKTIKTKLVQVGAEKIDMPYSLDSLILSESGKTVKEQIADLQPKEDDSLTTDNKTVTGSINELKTDVNDLDTKVGTKTDDTTSTPATGLFKYVDDNKTDIVDNYLGGKKLVYLTQAEYNALSDADKNDDSVVYCITDAEKIENIKPATTTELGGIIVGDTLNVDIDGLLDTKLTYDEITVTDVTIPDSGMSLGYLTSPNGNKFKLVVDDSGNLSTEQIIEYGNIVLSTNTLTIEEGKSSTFKVKLDKAPTNNEVINITTNNTDVTVNPTSLTFTKDDYNTEQTVTINVVEDSDTDNDSCVITLSNDNVDNKTININITDITPITKPCTSIVLDNSTLTIDTSVSNTATLTATVTPSDTTDNIVWSVNPTGVISINNGLVTAITNGTCTVTATCGTQTATCDVTVGNVTDGSYELSTSNITNYYGLANTSNVTDIDGGIQISNMNGRDYAFKIDYTLSTNTTYNVSFDYEWELTTPTSDSLTTVANFIMWFVTDGVQWYSTRVEETIKISSLPDVTGSKNITLSVTTKDTLTDSVNGIYFGNCNGNIAGNIKITNLKIVTQ